MDSKRDLSDTLKLSGKQPFKHGEMNLPTSLVSFHSVVSIALNHGTIKLIP